MSFFIAGRELEDDVLTFTMKSLVSGSHYEGVTVEGEGEDDCEDGEFNRRHKIRKAIVRKMKKEGGYKPNLHRSKG